MDGVQYRKLIGDARAFRQAAESTEHQIVRLNINPGDLSPIGMATSWPAHNVWESLKTVSHFNLGIALELRLKCFLWLLEMDPGNIHSFVELYDKLCLADSDIAESLERMFEQTTNDHPFSLLAFCLSTDKDTPPERPHNYSVNTLRGFFAYLDEEVGLSTKRYAWENAAKHHHWHHYLDRLEALFTFFDCSETTATKKAKGVGIIK